MAGYIAGRPCVFRGVKYLIGDLVPEESVDSKRIRVLIDSGHITKNPESQSEAMNEMEAIEALEAIKASATELKICITIGKSGDGTKTAVFLMPEEIESVFKTWIENVDTANGIIADMANPDILGAIKAKETRKGVLDAINKRMAELIPGTSGEAAEPAAEAAEVTEADTQTAEEGEEVGEA